MSENKKEKPKKKENETKTKTVSNKDTVKDSNKPSDEKSDAKANHSEKSFAGAGKGDKLRRGITQDAWGEKWEKIFKANKK
jgi:hypothetical protein